MNEQLLKSGNGLLHGVSTNSNQPRKTLILSDGEIVLCHLLLDSAFPTSTYTWEDGTEEARPGVLLDVVFVQDLRVKTDGQDLEIYWH